MKHDLKNTSYQKLLGDISFLLERARNQAYKAVDNIRVQTYWQIGERIAREDLHNKSRAIYSKRIIRKLSKDLGFGRVILYRILQFYNVYPIVSAVPRQLSWTHLVELLAINNPTERQFYEVLAAQNMWSSRQLREKIIEGVYFKKGKGSLFEKQVFLVPKEPAAVFKNIYNFEFLNLSGAHSEKSLERKLLSNIEKLLFEFGTDFALAGRQKKIVIDQQVHNIDLVFYHRGIPCVVLVELKIGRFRSEYVGQINKYLNYYRENKKYPWEKDPIGLIVCRNKGKEEAHYALGNITNHIFVAEYRTKLPSAGDILKKLKELNS
ncbi:MAG: DUF1016 family protein [Candidatus Saganbacteria bacterium]|nr:DUF1016 family protein [Candidatus Saganbacteria bacterium]